jgi:hypothetical protein
MITIQEEYFSAASLPLSPTFQYLGLSFQKALIPKISYSINNTPLAPKVIKLRI